MRRSLAREFHYLGAKWKVRETEFVLAFCIPDAGRYRSIGNCKSSVRTYVGGTRKFRPPRRRGGKLSGFHLASRIWFQISPASLPIEKQSALIATIGWSKNALSKFSYNRSSFQHPPRSGRAATWGWGGRGEGSPPPENFLTAGRERVFGSVGNTIASDTFWIRQLAITRLRTCLNNNLRRCAVRAKVSSSTHKSK